MNGQIEVIKDRYQLQEILGKGGVATTYQATDLNTKEVVAVKMMSLRRARDWKAIELFEREANILAQLQHPSIPRYLDYFQIDDERDRAFYIVQTLAPGESLAALIDRGWEPTLAEVEDIAGQVLEILIYLHQLKPAVIHRDIKPQNLIRSTDGKIYLVDFGSVQDTYHQTITGGSTVVGTYGYMAPEQFRGQAFLNTDLYGLGATLLFLLTRTDPSKLPQKQLKLDWRSPLNNVPAKFANWLDRMLEPASEQRFQNAAVAVEVLRGFAELPPRFISDRLRKPPGSNIRTIVDEDSLQIIVPPVRWRTAKSQQLLLLTIGMNLLLALYIYAAITTSANIDLFKIGSFALPFVAVSIALLIYTMYGNFYQSELTISTTEMTFRYRNVFSDSFLPERCCPIENASVTHTDKLSWLMFDRQRLRISFRFPDRIDRYNLGLLLTPTENKWLKSEIDRFITLKVLN